MRAIEFITEVRNRMYQYIKSIVPTWPDYIVKDWLYPGFSRYNDKTKRELLIMLNREGLNRNTQWQLVPNMKFTMDIWTSHTLKKLQGRAGGLSDMGMDIPRDAERHATQARLAQQQGGIRSEPVILIKRPDGYELLEGWHRTIQHFNKYPDGYTGPAYVAVAQGQQDVAEAVDIGKEWMSDTELDQYVPDHLQQQWRELLGYDMNGNPSAYWANLTGGYEPDVNDPQHRALMVKVANKWFTAKKIPNVKFFDVKDADDELEWLVQIGQQDVTEGWK